MADLPKFEPMLMPDCRAAFTKDLFVPKEGKNEKTGETTYRYSFSGLIPPLAQLAEEQKALLAKVNAAVNQILIAKFGDLSKVPSNIHRPFAKAEDKNTARAVQNPPKPPLAGYDPGWIVFSVSASQEPEVFDNKRGPDGKWLKIPKERGQREFYGGIWARCFVVPYWYANKSTGVALGLRGAQKIRDDKAFGGGGSMADMFEPLPNTGGDALDTGVTPPAPSGVDNLFG